LEAAEQIFTSIELEENNQKRLRLFELVSSEDSILMVGAGCSASIYPNWSQFMNKLQTESTNSKSTFSPYDGEKEDFLAFAERAKQCLGDDKYYNLIYTEFKPKPKSHEKYHEILCSLLNDGKFKAITTTNYDIALENAFATVTRNGADNSVWIDSVLEPAKIFEFLLSLNHAEVPKRILHLHGRYEHRNSIILSEQEYKSKYGFSITKPTTTIYQDIQSSSISEREFENLLYQHGYVWTQHRKILWSLFATRRVIFIGFSLNDPYFKKMLDFVREDLHTNGYDVHYLILRITAENKDRSLAVAKNLKNHGVETVFFEDDENFKGLERFIYEMEESVNMVNDENYDIVTDKAEQAADESLDDIALTQELMKISREKNNAD
jgi:DNA-binding LacI/PurR family transcriptional regulator